MKTEGRYPIDPSLILRSDNPKLESAAIQLFDAGREQRIYAVPPFTSVANLDIDDHPFDASKPDAPCDLCSAEHSFPGGVIADKKGGRMFVCCDIDHCAGRQAEGHSGRLSPEGRLSPLHSVREITRTYGPPDRLCCGPLRS